MTQSEFEHIAQELRSQMLKVALDFFGSQDDAEDVAQDAMVQLWHYCERIDSGRNVSGLAAVSTSIGSGRVPNSNTLRISVQGCCVRKTRQTLRRNAWKPWTHSA